MSIYARIEERKVMELLETDGDIKQMFHPSLVWVEVPDGLPVAQNWVWADGEFSAPAPIVPTEGELRALVLMQREVLLAAANEATAGMADAFIAGLLDEADTAMFKAFAAYKLALNKVEKQPGFPAEVIWPESP